MTLGDPHVSTRIAQLVNAQLSLLPRQHNSVLFYAAQRTLVLTSWLRRGLASRAILFLCSSFTGIRGLKNFGGWGENALKGLTVKA